MHMSSRVINKLGVAAAFILGAVAGNHIRKYREKVSLATYSGNTVELTQEDADEWFIEEKRSSIIAKIYHRLQAVSDNTAIRDTVTGSYMKIGKRICQQYLQYRGLLEGSSELWIKDWLNETDWIDSVDFWTRLPPLQILSSPTYFATLYAGVRALWYISCSSDFNKKNSFLDYDLAMTLKQVVDEKDDYVTPLALKIIANVIAMKKDLHFLHETGLLDTLTHCANDKESQIFLPAWRALHNLKVTNETKSACKNLYLEGVYPFVLPDDNKAPLLDIILVHGIKGGAAWTWRQHDQQRYRPLLSQEKRRNILKGQNIEDVDEFYTCCWPLDWLVPTLKLPVRVIAVNFKCGWWRWESECSTEGTGKSVIERSRDMAHALAAAGVGERPIIWISHSMGGLLVKNMLVELKSKSSGDNDVFAKEYSKEEFFSQVKHNQWEANSFAKQTMAIVFFSVPHQGSPLATSVTQGVLRQVLQPATELCEMRTDNPALHHLNQLFVSLAKAQSIAVLTLNESEPVLHKTTGYPLHFIPPEFGGKKTCSLLLGCHFLQ
ncbi:protein SERAC1 isoform X1 [Cherax quadricarinatus]